MHLGGHQPPKVPSWCQVQIKISAGWLLGHNTEAPMLTGHGPLPADVALRQIAGAAWQRIVYDPLTGALLDVGTTVHDPPASLRKHVLVRDGGCTQPICGNPRVDLDHNIPYPHGPTSAGNLRSRCRHHHHLKQHRNGSPARAPTAGSTGSPPPGTSTPNIHPTSDRRLSAGPTPNPASDPNPAISKNNPTAPTTHHRSDLLEYVESPSLPTDRYDPGLTVLRCVKQSSLCSSRVFGFSSSSEGHWWYCRVIGHR